MVRKIYKRKYKAVLHRRKGMSTEVIFTRFFGSFAGVICRGGELAMLTGQPGDVLEVIHSEFEFQIATLKLKVRKNQLFGGMTWEFHQDFAFPGFEHI